MRKIEKSKKIVLKKSEKVRGISVKGVFNNNAKIKNFVKNYRRIGFQATNVAKAFEIIRKIKKERAIIFFGYTSNIISSGLRDLIALLVRYKKVDVLVTTGGGVEEDVIKTLNPFYLKDYSNFENTNDIELRRRGINRIYNILVPNSNYVNFEKFIMPFFDFIAEKEISSSEFINLLGYWLEKTKNKKRKESICYWAYKNNIPVFCPTLTDGSIGDMIYFYTQYKKRNIIINQVKDTQKINEIAMNAKSTAIISLGSGVVSHYMLNANLFRNGCDYAIYINDAIPYDGSAAGAPPEEAISWGKIKDKSRYVKIFGDATIIFPLLMTAFFD
jgi:deoxyhypusine synthase